VPTIGVALAIPEPFGAELRAARLRFGDPLASQIPTHVTLLPPTEIDSSLIDTVDEHLVEVAVGQASFGMVLRGTGTFRPLSPVVFIQVAKGLADCEMLAAKVRRGPLPLAVRRLEFPYHPHVTVAHHTPDAAMDRAFDELADYEAVFDIDSFGLYRHGLDGVWRPVRTYAFGADGAAGSTPRGRHRVSAGGIGGR
jgi:2'-5' RNA ligase